MAIDQLHSHTAASKSFSNGVQGGATAAKQDKGTAPTTGNEQQAGKVSISPEASRLNQLESKIHAADDVDSQRVADIKRSIDEGSYQINAESIAGKLLDQDDFFA